MIDRSTESTVLAAEQGSRSHPPEPRATRSQGRRARSRWWHVLALGLLGVVALVATAIALRKPVIPDPLRPETVEPFALRDANGRVHRRTDWRDARAVVLFVIGTDCPVSAAYAREMRRLTNAYRSKGVLFFGVVPDPSAAPESVSQNAVRLGLPFPVLLDPAHELTAALGACVTPEAAVLDAQGHLRYHGAIDDRDPIKGEPNAAPSRRLLELALRAVLQEREPSVRSSPALGSPLPKPGPILPEDETITYNKHVAPILWQHCAGCHRPGEVGPFPLLTYRHAAKRAEFLRDVAASRQMPPWRAVYGYGDFHDDDRLSRRELALLDRWVKAGAPEGDPVDRAEPPTFPEGWHLGTPDLVVAMPEPFNVPADGDTYRAFVLPIPLDRDTPIAAVEFRPGNRRIVHHARFYADPTDECRRRDTAEPGAGFISFGGGDIFKPGLGAWVPGLIPRKPPADVAKLVREGSDLVMLIHYHGTGKPETDQSRIGLYFCKQPPKRSLSYISLNSNQIDIPPGEDRHRIAVTTHMIADAHAYSVIPHGHYLMREISLTATLPSGRVVPMLWIDNWNFNWQGQYHFARPVALPKGTRLDLVAYYDNSAENPFNPHHPPRRVRLGFASTDEMLGCHVQVIADDAKAQAVFDRALPFGL